MEWPSEQLVSKAITGAAELVGAVATGVAMAALASTGAGAAALPFLGGLLKTLAVSGIASEAGAIADAITGNRGMQIATRQPASNRVISYGTQMLGGVYADMSTTGHQYNRVIMLASHSIHSIQGIWLDGRKIYFKGSGNGWSVRNGVGFGGDADSNDHYGPDGVTKYNFGGKVFVEARFGDQVFGDYMGSLAGNDHTFGPSGDDCPSFVGNAYLYVKVTADANQFPSPPEIRVLFNGKDDILDPRTGNKGFTNNSALVFADFVQDSNFGLGDSNIDEAILIQAANICDEQVAVAALSGATESRYCCDYSFDTGTSPADVLETMRVSMNALTPQIGGVWTILPGVYTAPVLHMDKSALTGPVHWTPERSVKDRVNCVLATHISAEYPYSVA